MAMMRTLAFRKRRLLGVGLATMIGAGFLVLTMLTGETIQTAFRDSVGREYRPIDLEVELADGMQWKTATESIANLPGVTAVQPAADFWIDTQAGGRANVVPFTTLPPPGAMRDGLEMDSGRLPERSGEIVLHRQLARDFGLELDGVLTLLPPMMDDATPTPVTVTVVGLWSGEGRFGPGEYMAFMTPDTAAPWLNDLWIPSLHVELGSEADTAAATGAIERSIPDASVLPASELIDRELDRYQDEWGIVRLGITSFAILALFVAGMVVANTCAILVAQRTREIALFRCAGATASQMRLLVMVEAISAGLVASIAGVLLAWVFGNTVLAALDVMGILTALPDRIGLSPAMIVAPIVAGLVVSVAAAWAPARTAARVDPLQALRVAQAPPMDSSRPDPIRLGIAILLMAGGSVFLLGGAAISYGGSPQSGVLVGIVGGIGTFLGVLVAATMIVPGINRLVLRIADRFPSIPLRVAASNGVRNPRRATASTVALVIGVTLVSMMVVGADSLKATMAGEIDSRAPWDLDVRFDVTPDAATAEEFAGAVEMLDGVAAIALMDEVEASYEDSYGGTITNAQIVDPAALQAVWRDSAALAGFGPGVALVPGWLLDTTGLSDGDTLALDIAGTLVPFTISETRAWDSIIVPSADVEGIDASVTPAGLVVRLDDDAGTDEVLDAIYDTAGERNIAIAADALANQRETLEQALDTMLYIVTGLLAVAVLIAVIGVGNTLSLSVIERTSESALLRAVGYTRSQLRRTLMLEGILLAAIGSAIGLVLGLAYGWIGAFTLVGNTFTMVPGFPAGRLAAIAAVAIACGLLASVLPARRAASVEPAVALADH